MAAQTAGCREVDVSYRKAYWLHFAASCCNRIAACRISRHRGRYKPQRHYCGDRFIQGDALETPPDSYDFIWASPPCQAHICA